MKKVLKSVFMIVALLCVLVTAYSSSVYASVDQAVFEQFYPCFYQYNWQTYTDEMKQKLIEYLTVAYCQELEVAPVNVKFENLGPNTYAEFRTADNEVVYNTTYLYSALNMYKSIAHECRHAWQFSNSYYIDNFANYINPTSSYSQYLTQPIEMDANAFAEMEYFKLVQYSQAKADG